MADSTVSQIAGVVGKIVPGLAGVLFGPAGTLVANGVMEAAKAVFGDDVDGADALERAIAADPGKALEFKSKLLEIQDAERQRQHDERMAEIGDGQNARNAFIATRSRTVPALTIITAVMFFVFNGTALYAMWALFNRTVHINPEDVQIALFAAGTFGSILTYVNSKAEQVWGFFFGSSHSSAQKTEAMSSSLTDALKQAVGGKK